MKSNAHTLGLDNYSKKARKKESPIGEKQTTRFEWTEPKTRINQSISINRLNKPFCWKVSWNGHNFVMPVDCEPAHTHTVTQLTKVSPFSLLYSDCCPRTAAVHKREYIDTSDAYAHLKSRAFSILTTRLRLFSRDQVNVNKHVRCVGVDLDCYLRNYLSTRARVCPCVSLCVICDIKISFRPSPPPKKRDSVPRLKPNCGQLFPIIEEETLSAPFKVDPKNLFNQKSYQFQLQTYQRHLFPCSDGVCVCVRET